jgi:hypothetical protein
MEINPLNTELNPICHLLALLGAHPILHISRIRVKLDHMSKRNPDTYFNYVHNNWLARSLPHDRRKLSSLAGCNMDTIQFIQYITNFNLVLPKHRNFPQNISINSTF